MFTAFLFGFLVDILYAFFHFFLVKKDKLKAIISGQLLTLIGMIGYEDVFKDHSLRIPYLIGVGCGIYFGIWLNEKLSKK